MASASHIAGVSPAPLDSAFKRTLPLVADFLDDKSKDSISATYVSARADLRSLLRPEDPASPPFDRRRLVTVFRTQDPHKIDAALADTSFITTTINAALEDTSFIITTTTLKHMLCFACRTGNTPVVEAVIRKAQAIDRSGASGRFQSNPNEIDCIDCNVALVSAVLQGHRHLVELLRRFCTPQTVMLAEHILENPGKSPPHYPIRRDECLHLTNLIRSALLASAYDVVEFLLKHCSEHRYFHSVSDVFYGPTNKIDLSTFESFFKYIYPPEHITAFFICLAAQRGDLRKLNLFLSSLPVKLPYDDAALRRKYLPYTMLVKYRAIDTAIKHGHLDIVQYLMDTYDLGKEFDPRQLDGVLDLAVKSSHRPTLQYLNNLAKFRDCDAQTAIATALGSNRYLLADDLITPRPGRRTQIGIARGIFAASETCYLNERTPRPDEGLDDREQFRDIRVPVEYIGNGPKQVSPEVLGCWLLEQAFINENDEAPSHAQLVLWCIRNIGVGPERIPAAFAQFAVQMFPLPTADIAEIQAITGEIRALDVPTFLPHLLRLASASNCYKTVAYLLRAYPAAFTREDLETALFDAIEGDGRVAPLLEHMNSQAIADARILAAERGAWRTILDLCVYRLTPDFDESASLSRVLREAVMREYRNIVFDICYNMTHVLFYRIGNHIVYSEVLPIAEESKPAMAALIKLIFPPSRPTPTLIARITNTVSRVFTRMLGR